MPWHHHQLHRNHACNILLTTGHQEPSLPEVAAHTGFQMPQQAAAERHAHPEPTSGAVVAVAFRYAELL